MPPSDVDADVVSAVVARRVVNRHQVARAEVTQGNTGTTTRLVRTDAGQVAAHLAVDVLHEAGAVVAAGAGPTPHVGDAEELLGVVHDTAVATATARGRHVER